MPRTRSLPNDQRLRPIGHVGGPADRAGPVRRPARCRKRAAGQRADRGDSVSLHARLGVAVVIVAAAGALLVLLARRRPAMVPTVRVFVCLCGALAALQAVIGLVVLAIGERPAEGIHLFYGAATVLPIPL